MTKIWPNNPPYLGNAARVTLIRTQEVAYGLFIVTEIGDLE